MRKIVAISKVVAMCATAALICNHQEPSVASPLPPSSTQRPIDYRAVPPTKPAPAVRHEGEEPVRANIDAWMRAYNAHDAAAIGELVTDRAELLDGQGNLYRGREEIQSEFARLFREYPDAHLDVAVDAIRFVSPTTAVEEGMALVRYGAGQPAESRRYVAVHVKDGEAWRLASCRDVPASEGNGKEQLRQVAWLIGDWTAEKSNVQASYSYRWSRDRTCIEGEFTLRRPGQPALSGTHRIGWDPMERKIHEWTFYDGGGYSEGTWTRSGNQWVVQTSGVAGDGRLMSSTATATVESKDRVLWKISDRVHGDQIIGENEEILFVAKPLAANQ